MMEAEDSVHSDDVWDDEVGQHDVQADVPELLVVPGQVGVQTAVNVPQVFNRLQGHLQIVRTNMVNNSYHLFNTIHTAIVFPYKCFELAVIL